MHSNNERLKLKRTTSESKGGEPGSSLKSLGWSRNHPARRMVTAFIAMVVAATTLIGINGANNNPAGAQVGTCRWDQASNLAPGTATGVWNSEIVTFRGRILLSGKTNFGHEPVTYDGTTYRVLRNLAPGAQSSFPEFKATTRSQAFFTANIAGRGRELWVTNGTSAGTRQVRSLTAGSGSTNFQEFAVVGNRVFFTVRRANVHQLWRSNGTTQGTVLVRNFPLTSQPRNLVGLGNKLLFGSRDAAAGHELWVSNGLGKGTRRLIDLRPGAAGSNALPIRAYRGRVYVNAYAGPGRPTLFSTDGTRTGTRAVADLDPNSNASDPTVVDSAVMNGRLYLWVKGRVSEGANRNLVDLWITNGTQAGTRPVVNTNAGILPHTARPQSIATGGRIFYLSDKAATGRQWNVVKPGSGFARFDINPGTADASVSGAPPVAFKGAVYVVATNPTTGRELFKLSCTG